MHLMPPSWAAPHEFDLPGNKSNTWHPMWNFNPINENLDQGSRKCRRRLIGQTTQTYAVLSRNSICRDLRTFSEVIFPSFDGNSYICGIHTPPPLNGKSAKLFQKFFFLKGLKMMFLYLIRLKMDQKGHIINQKGLKMYQKGKK